MPDTGTPPHPSDPNPTPAPNTTRSLTGEPSAAYPAQPQAQKATATPGRLAVVMPVTTFNHARLLSGTLAAAHEAGHVA
ncbi:hypothetical protein EDD27_0021 [Nonomuraea polychroma]|uniref:Uncharacterized protein n=1 Tax=Nonomuraea polychroma TaxID=46176 RepID=A0A438LWM1_9ACTN|nr:hypothetical protein EDD27_0021 [Nonomuraea polychroma]